MTQIHHFLPRTIYGNKLAKRGQSAYYCQWHHSNWHKLVTPHINERDAA
jgi:hypothetical protein